MTRRDQLIRQIELAFHGVELGNGVGLQEGQGLDDRADERTISSYRKLDEKDDWAAIAVTELDQWSSSLSFFDADGMRFHLPAYLIADIKGQLGIVDITFALTDLDDRRWSQFASLSTRQCRAVRDYLLLRLSDPQYEFNHPAIKAALDDYWAAAAS